MGFLSLLEVASMPVVQVILISFLGAFLATGYCNLLHAEARSSLNKLVFMVFTPSLVFANLAKTVTLEDIISWWFMPVNVGATFLIGSVLGWLVVKIVKPKPQLEGLIVAACSSGNMGNLPIILVPAICNEEANPFGSRSMCRATGLSYASFSMALGSLYCWTYTYQLVHGSAMRIKALDATPNNGLDADQETSLLNGHRVDDQDPETQVFEQAASCWKKAAEYAKTVVKELFVPPTAAAIAGFIVGATEGLRNLIIGDDAPVRVIEASLQTLGAGTIPSITLILGGNLVQGLKSKSIKPAITIGVVVVRFIMLPAIGVGIVKAADNFGFLPGEPLFMYVLMLQYTVPPAMAIGTMAQLFDVGQDECAVLLVWAYLAAGLAITFWSTLFMSILS